MGLDLDQLTNNICIRFDLCCCCLNEFASFIISNLIPCEMKRNNEFINHIKTRLQDRKFIEVCYEHDNLDLGK